MSAYQPGLGEYLSLLLLTIALEAPFYLAALRREGLRGALGLLVAANVLTHAFVVLALPPFAAAAGLSRPAYVLGAESFAILAETAFLADRLPLRSAALTALFANVASWTIGSRILVLAS